MKTKSGHPVVRTNFITEVSVPDAQKYLAKVAAGAQFDGHGHLVIGNVTGVSSEVKKLLSSRNPDAKNPPPVAVVLGSALARMTAQLMMRVTGNENSAFFKTEEEALIWLEARMAEFMRKRGK